MKHLLLLILTGTTISNFGQSKDETALLSINRQFIRNFLNNDTVEHNKIIHPSNFLFIGTNGKILGRNEYMQAWAYGYDKTIMPEFDLEDVQIRMFDNMALIVARTKIKKQRMVCLLPAKRDIPIPMLRKKENGNVYRYNLQGLQISLHI